jgi:hypothetical protein
VALCAALIVALFLVGWRAPMRIGTDAAIQLIPFEQWARGASPTPLQLTTADPAMPSTDRHEWIIAWPPALPAALVAGRAVGLHATTTMRVLSLVSLLLGALGWLRIARRVEATPGQTVVFAVLLGARAASAALGSPADGLQTMEPVAFAAVPWILLTLSGVVDSPITTARALVLGLAAGSVALAKYSTLFVTAGAVAVVALQRWWRDRRVAPPFAMGIGLSAPFVSLALAYRAILHVSPGRFHAEWAAAHSHPWSDVVLGTVTALGRSAFEVTFPLMHVFAIGSPANRLFPELGFLDRVRVVMLLSVPLTVAVCWLFTRARHRVPRPWWSLITAAAASLLLLITALGVQNKFNYFNENAARYFACIAPGIELLILRAAWDLPLWSRRGWRTAGLSVALAGSVAATAFLVHDVRRSTPGGSRYALPRGTESARPMLARVSREAAGVGAIVAVSWNDFDLPFALSLPNRLYFPFDSVHLRMDPRTPIVLIAQPSTTGAPPSAALRSFDPSITWVRKADETDANVGVWHAVFPPRGGTP